MAMGTDVESFSQNHWSYHNSLQALYGVIF